MHFMLIDVFINYCKCFSFKTSKQILMIMDSQKTILPHRIIYIYIYTLSFVNLCTLQSKAIELKQLF